jgi:type I restriction enzyme M protein
MPTLDLPTLEAWLWDAACAIRGPVDAPKFKDYILPLVFLKRLSDVFEDEVTQKYGTLEEAEPILEAEREEGLFRSGRGSVRFYIPPKAPWEAILSHGQTGLGQYLTDAVRSVAQENPRLHGVIDIKLDLRGLHLHR